MKKGFRMKLTKINNLLYIFVLLTLSGCGTRYDRWVCDIFHQGTKVPNSLVCAEKYVRSLHVYDYFTTLGLFEALWLSDEVYSIYDQLQNQMQCDCACKGDEPCKDDDACSTFIVLAWIKGYEGTYLTDECPLWSLCLSVNCKTYGPCCIKQIDVCPEYQAMFGRRFTRFKTAYKVTFNVSNDTLISAKKFEFIFKRIGVQGSMIWCLDSCGKPYIDTKVDKNILMYDIK